MAKQKSKENYDKKANVIKYKTDDLVYMIDKRTYKNKKLKPRWEGPYKIIQINSPTNVTLKVRRKKLVLHIDRIKPANIRN